MPIWPKACRSKALFTEAFIRLNHLGGEGFTAWVFHPDMLFGAEGNWWGSKRQRPKPHEGIDLCLYRDGHDRIIPVEARTRVPAIFEGMVVKMMADFLGQSILLEHRFPEIRPGVLLTIYGHTVPTEGLALGQRVKQGQMIATIAPPKGQKILVPPHLHVTTAWSSKVPAYTTMDWTTISDPERLQLLDPLQLLGGKYVLVDSSSTPMRKF
jgi:murein DD-endopeptidase MepM/ murein hydrolase activator NlpD